MACKEGRGTCPLLRGPCTRRPQAGRNAARRGRHTPVSCTPCNPGPVGEVPADVSPDERDSRSRPRRRRFHCGRRNKHPSPVDPLHRTNQLGLLESARASFVRPMKPDADPDTWTRPRPRPWPLPWPLRPTPETPAAHPVAAASLHGMQGRPRQPVPRARPTPVPCTRCNPGPTGGSWSGGPAAPPARLPPWTLPQVALDGDDVLELLDPAHDPGQLRHRGDLQRGCHDRGVVG